MRRFVILTVNGGTFDMGCTPGQVPNLRRASLTECYARTAQEHQPNTQRTDGHILGHISLGSPMLVALRRTVATLGVLLLAACPAPADLDADVASLDYGEVVLGSSLALPIALTNVGENKATVSFRIDNSVFVLGLGGAIEVLPGGSRVVHFYAEPTTVGPVTGTLTIAWNATDTLTIPMSVTGIAADADDADADGYTADVDCDDSDPGVNPGADEVCDAIDNNCEGGIDEGFDVDEDMYTTCGADGTVGTEDDDCLDTNSSINPGAEELCNGEDDNCDTVTDEGFDFDLDFVTSCGPDGIAGNADDDCNDSDINAYPGAPEACGGGTDLNCDSVLPDPCGGDDCADILATSPASPSGTYTVDPAGNGVGFDAYCDMTTDAGGWTMVLRTTDDGLANAALAAAGSYASIHDDFVPSTGYDPSLGTPVRVPAQYWDDFALVGEVMVREVLLKADGTNCTPLHHSASGILSVPAVAVGLNIVWTMSGTDPNDVLNGTQAGAFPILQTTDRYTVAGNCVGGNGSAPWFMGTCNGGLMPASGDGFWTSAEPRPVVYFDRVDDGGTDLNGSDFATACGGAAMMNPPASALGPASAWYTHSSVEYYFR